MCVCVCLQALLVFSTVVLMGFDYIYIEKERDTLCSRPIFGLLGLTVKQNWVEVTDLQNIYI